MENNPTITFPMNEEARFFVCRSCQTHILPGNDVLHISPSGSRNRILCRPPVNVRDEPTIAPMFYRFLPSRNSSAALGHSPFSFHTYPVTSLSIHCNVCNRHLGRRTIRHPGVGLGNQLRPRRRRTRLDLDQLLQWNGTGMVYADTLQALNQNPGLPDNQNPGQPANQNSDQ